VKHAKFVFLDTAYAYALINTRDQWHERAVVWQERLATERKLLLSTEFVLLEIVSLSSELLEEAFKLYKKRADKVSVPSFSTFWGFHFVPSTQ